MSNDEGVPVVVRRPLLDTRQLASLCEALERGDDTELRNRLADADVAEALEIAAPDLTAQIDRFRTEAGPAFTPKRRRRLYQALHRYTMRGITRATPYGTFAGIGAATRSGMDDTPTAAETPTRCIRPSAHWVRQLCDTIMADAEAVSQLRLIASRSVYDSAEALIVAYSDTPDTAGHIVRNNLGIVREVLAACTDWQPFGAVVQFVKTRAGAGHDEATTYVRKLIEHALLTTELSALQLSPAPFRELLTVCSAKHTSRSDSRPFWPGLHAGLADIDKRAQRIARPTRTVVDEYRNIRTAMTDLLPQHPPDLHVDAVNAGTAELMLPADGTVEAAASLVRSLFPSRPPAAVVAVRDWLKRHYGDGQLVPLSAVVRPDTGIDLDHSTSSHAATRLDDSGLRSARQFALPVDEVDVEAILGENPHAAPSPSRRDSHVSMALLRQIDSGDGPPWLELRSVGSSLSLLGRFAQFDANVLAACRGYVMREEALDDDNVIRAEVRGHYIGRATNVATRPIMRRYCIDLGPPTEGADAFGRSIHSIPLRDVMICTRRDAVEIYHRSSGRRIIPTVATAVRPDLATHPVVSILHGLSLAEVDGSGWMWGKLERLPSLPRVTFKGIVLSPRRWTIQREHFHDAVDRQLPRFVEVEAGKRSGVYDLSSSFGREGLRAAFPPGGHADRSELTIREAGIRDVALSAVSVCEPVVTISRDARTRRQRTVAPGPTGGRRDVPIDHHRPHRVRSFGPGSTWASLRLYAQRSQMNTLLAAIGATMAAFRQQHDGLDWFYIRYADDDPYLRVRLRCDDVALLWGDCVPRIDAMLTDWSADVSVIADRYVPEVDRYGGPDAITICERWFGADSRYAVASIANGNAELEHVLHNVDVLFRAAGLSLQQRRDMARSCEIGGPNAALARSAMKEAGERFRNGLRLDLGTPSTMSSSSAAAGWPDETARSLRALREVVGPSGTSYSRIVSSFAHMHCNRMFERDINFQELVAYSTLRRMYDSELKRATSWAPAPRASGIGSGAHPAPAPVVDHAGQVTTAVTAGASWNEPDHEPTTTEPT